MCWGGGGESEREGRERVRVHARILWCTTQNSVVGMQPAPQNSVVCTTKFCGVHHKILWWAPQNSVVVPRQTEFSERKRKQVLSYGEQYLLNGRS